MAAELTGNGTFFVATALVQFAFAGLLFYTSNRSSVNRLLGFIFLINGVIAVFNGLPEIWLHDAAVGKIAPRLAYSLEYVTNFLIVYFAFAYPKRAKFVERHRNLTVWFFVLLSLAFWLPVVLFPELQGAGSYNGNPASWAHYIFFEFISAIAFPIVIVRWAWLMKQGMQPVQLAAFKFVFAAFAVRAVHTIGTWGTHSVTNAVRAMIETSTFWFYGLFTDVIPGVIQFGSLFAATWILLRMRKNSSLELERAINFVLAFMLGGLALAAFDLLALAPTASNSRIFKINPLANVDVLVIRPILIWAALVRHHFVGNSMSAKKESQTIAFFVTAPTSFGISMQLLGADGAAPATDVLLALLIAAMSGTFVAVAFHSLLQRYGSKSLGVRQADADYLSALEDLYRRGAQASGERRNLDVLAAKLGVPSERATELESLVQSFLSQVNEHSQWNVGDRVLGRYRIEEHLGEGGMGNAYRCFDELTETQVALKRRKSTNPTTMAAIHQEAKALAALDHPNIVRLIRTETAASELILVTEYLPGGTLEQRLRGTKCKPDEMRKMVKNLLSALQAAHRHGVVHRDIKPSNILFDEHGVAKIADFGIARELDVGDTLVGATSAATALLGSIRYVAPEQLAKGHVSRRSDLYSLGVVILDCALSTGEGANLRTPMSPTERRQGIARLPRDLRQTFKAITSPLPAERPKDATQAMLGLSL